MKLSETPRKTLKTQRVNRKLKSTLHKSANKPFTIKRSTKLHDATIRTGGTLSTLKELADENFSLT